MRWSEPPSISAIEDGRHRVWLLAGLVVPASSYRRRGRDRSSPGALRVASAWPGSPLIAAGSPRRCGGRAMRRLGAARGAASPALPAMAVGASVPAVASGPVPAAPDPCADRSGGSLRPSRPIARRCSASARRQRQRWRIRSVTQPDRRAMVVVSLASCTRSSAPLHAHAIGPGGDEPHYLVIAHSLLADGDLQIENNHTGATTRRSGRASCAPTT